MPNAENKKLVENIKSKFAKAKSVVVTDYIGITSQDANEFRQKIKESDAEVFIAKNTLMKVALKDYAKDMPNIENDLKGPTAVIFSYSDAIAPIKTIFDFIKKIELPKLKSAVIGGQYYSAEKLEVIKTIGTKEQLIGQMLGGLQSPLVGFVGVLGGVQRKFVYAINAIAKSKGGAN